MPTHTKPPLDKVRIDKWLWAARFYKSRTLAKEAVEGGKVHVEGQRVKPSKDVIIGITIKIKSGLDDKTVVVTALAERRGNAKEAALLFEETKESQIARETAAEQRKLLHAAMPYTNGKPNKKERRQITRFQQNND